MFYLLRMDGERAIILNRAARPGDLLTTSASNLVVSESALLRCYSFKNGSLVRDWAAVTSCE